MRTGNRVQTAMENATAARMGRGATSLRMLPSPGARPAPAVALRRPNPVEQMLNEVLEDGGVQLVHDLLAVALGEDEPRVAEGAEVTRDRRPGSGELLGDLAGRLGTITQQPEDLPAGGVGERAKGVHAANIAYLADYASTQLTAPGQRAGKRSCIIRRS